MSKPDQETDFFCVGPKQAESRCQVVLERLDVTGVLTAETRDGARSVKRDVLSLIARVA